MEKRRTEKAETKKTLPKAFKATASQALKHVNRSQPFLNQRAPEVQKFGEFFPVAVGLPQRVIEASVTAMNQILADTIVIKDMYKKHHWQVSGPTFYQLHLLLDKHFGEQVELVDMLAERIQAFGGISIAMPQDVSEMTSIERPPRGREETPVQLSRLLEAHEIILKEARKAAKAAADKGDDGTNDILVSNIIRTNEAQAWFLAEHLVNLPTVKADAGGTKDFSAADGLMKNGKKGPRNKSMLS